MDKIVEQEVPMKLFILMFSLFSFSALAHVELSYQTNIKLQKTVMKGEILLKDILRLQTHLGFENRRMIAANGHFDKLRTKLNGSKGIVRI